MPRRPFFYGRNTSAKRVFSRTLGRQITSRVRAEAKYSNLYNDNQNIYGGEQFDVLRAEALLLRTQEQETKALSKDFEKLCEARDFVFKVWAVLAILLVLYVIFIFGCVIIAIDLIGRSWPFLGLIPLVGIFFLIYSSFQRKAKQMMDVLSLEIPLST